MPNKRNRKPDVTEKKHGQGKKGEDERSPNAMDKDAQNPPRTTSKGWMTTPKFGSSTSGGGEIEPGPERD
jgi:hypothetical protein